ncbi:MAG: hypothetical protein Q8O03_06735 [Nanoarchaeota archaeon]|nr:hypothetical protein [Nanoarchaeota archaeon]
MKQHKTNWRTIAVWAAVILGIVAVLVFDLNPIWLFILAMIACYLGHRLIIKGGHH